MSDDRLACSDASVAGSRRFGRKRNGRGLAARLGTPERSAGERGYCAPGYQCAASPPQSTGEDGITHEVRRSEECRLLRRGVAWVDCTTSAGASSSLMDSKAIGSKFLASGQGKLSFKAFELYAPRAFARSWEGFCLRNARRSKHFLGDHSS